MKHLFIIILFVGFIFSCNTSTKPSEYIASSGPVVDNTCPTMDSIHFCKDKTDSFCSNIPLDVYFLGGNNGNFENGYSSVLTPDIQPSFDNFSWQSFVALNWASDASGNAIGSSITDYQDSLRVWERFTDASKVFSADHSELKNLKSSHPMAKVISQNSKVSNALNVNGFLEADDFPLIDKNLNFVVYEVKMNAVEEAYIASNNLTTKEDIYNYVHDSKTSIELPVNTTTKEGAIEIKASWRILDATKGDDLSKYYTQDATIYVSSENSVSGQSFTFKATIGLVGLHILRKTEKFQNWIWTTFEHVDNVPDNIQQAQTNQETNWSFYNSECLNCPVNQPPSHIFPRDITASNDTVYKWNTTAPYAKPYGVSIAGEADHKTFGTQVTRVYPVYYCTEQLNDLWQSKLSESGSVFANYKLIGTQWMVPTDGAPPAIKINAPSLLANTTAETYMQEGSSCISCHTFATVKYVTKSIDTTITTDFSFTFGYAQ
ncbi:hypothetical protein [Psychroserpens algicola]|uniref:hypothetical protein n=1 Tax=Psychroserpens algicola TaxID=1719034 RepID=UPI001954BE3E|nr:hypothetical protein [Psychroserpens algicola]